MTIIELASHVLVVTIPSLMILAYDRSIEH